MSEHTRASELLVWRVNGRLSGSDLLWLNTHLADCDSCSAELAVQRRVRDAIAREPTVEFAPQASFNRLWQKIDAEAFEPGPVALGVTAEHGVAPGLAPATLAGSMTGASLVRRRPGATWLRAAVAAQALTIVILSGVLWQRASRAPVTAPAGPAATSYRTVTDAPAALLSARPSITVLFDDQLRLAEVKDLLARTQLVVAAGPTAAGIYTLVARDAQATPVSIATAARLRAHPAVKFAEFVE